MQFFSTGARAALALACATVVTTTVWAAPALADAAAASGTWSSAVNAGGRAGSYPAAVTVPAHSTVTVVVVGGGGGGGGGSWERDKPALNDYGNGGGGGGAMTCTWDADQQTTLDVVVGAGGAAGLNSNDNNNLATDGRDGESSSVSQPGVFTIRGTGGQGGGILSSRHSEGGTGEARGVECTDGAPEPGLRGETGLEGNNGVGGRAAENGKLGGRGGDAGFGGGYANRTYTPPTDGQTGGVTISWEAVL
ncbi:glycine-rich domain-containing protein [Streptomyces erythrochromogenes]|uniref:glycine-rich domain-containing protein n=1 Tax=Streptomyces erythrochromogenes TaxID=285574 RepID=UPI0036A12D85